MSGSSAVASARRRRAEPTPQSIVQPGKNSTSSNQINTQNDSSQKQQTTPLLLLQEHDKKLKEFEANLEKNIVEISKKVLAENLKHFNLDKPLIATKEFDSGPLIEKFDTLLSNFDELKTLVIKSQNMSLETNTEMLKIKDKVLEVQENFTRLELHIKEPELNETNIFNMNGETDAAEMFLKTMMQSGIMGNVKDSKLNIHDNDTDEDINELGDVDEITLTESELDKLKNEVSSEINELSEENIKPDEQISNELIQVSDNENENENENEKEK
tara:strand:+ start:6497 stop:7312 length:816 start_codon:yes stop_codon:yes gene_type:complete